MPRIRYLLALNLFPEENIDGLAMKTKEFREKTQAELEQKLHSLKEELFNLRYQAKTGRLEKPSLIRNIKRDIAKIFTIVKEKENEQKKQQKKD